METTMTTDKNNFFCGGQLGSRVRSACSLPHGLRTPARGGYARRFRSAARFRGEKEDVVFTSCFCCFQ